jgi:Carboxylesterase family
LTYLWWSNPKLRLVDSPKIDSEFNFIKTMINIWTNFAVSGNIDCMETGNTGWKALSSIDEPLKCLNISNKSVEVIDFPETERLKIWDEVFNDSNAELF